MGRFYRLPVWGLAGATDSKLVDAQAGAEAAYELLLAHLSGANLIHDVGYTTGGINSSMEMLLLCDEIISMVKKVGEGITISDETLALDVIHEVGPRKHFLAHPHTAEHCRQAWSPRFFDRQAFELWEQAGKKDTYAVLRERAKEILAQHTVEPLPTNVLKKLDAVAEARMNAGES
jgi:trimethylamine--corrinoid protein Co-methyltransferase